MKEEIHMSQGMNCQGHGILVLVAGIPNSDTDKFKSESDCTVGKSSSIHPGGYPPVSYTHLTLPTIYSV